ncbi:MAG: 30S ribosome-binding factor RbfA [candidate division Zixibacteria bacterium]|nr:30S ribosome-binding factor RbfA [candidate division Zixibacteria bacterium]NIR63736.1 30S ribosome-binding factor RbfA [candidate division Zixibacteria bacterium]NIS14693.1 30S ribosome-binding factor RbfA [candidate division Zixibacteria bacterium]NIS45692.1 30S ribosome-binding factor RbfA [candidate division Zixibacteria bacterium]NIT51221.1 30S ribosome-binding factor RbfA [candidate division Zixibacteria bacterium]
MREFSRKDRLSDQIKRETADILQNVLKDPRIGFVTITDVELTNDLRYAKIFYSVLGDESEKAQTGKALSNSLGVIQSELARRLNIRKAPLISFHLDTSAEYGAKMEKLFKKIEEERNERDDEGNSSRE